MPTEDDLRAALTSLERHAPAAARVLPEGGRPRRQPRSPRATRWLAGVTTAAALAGLVTALTLPGGTPGTIPNGAVTSPSVPANATTLRAKLLAAFSAASDEIVYMRGTYQTAGPHTDPSPATEQVWYYPGQPNVGQMVRARTASVEAGFGHTDVGISYRQPAPKAGLPPGTAQVKGERISVGYAGRTWSDVKDTMVMFQPPYNPALIASYLKSKQWSARDTTLNGRPAIELTLKEVVLKGEATVNSWTEYLWVDASTYLPLHDVTTFGPPGEVTHAVEDFRYLPATPANLAQLTPPIPAGFKKVTPSPVVAPAGSASAAVTISPTRSAPAVTTLSPKPAPSRTPSPAASPSSR